MIEVGGFYRLRGVRVPKRLDVPVNRWKVTALFSVQSDAATSLPCVRVRRGTGGSEYFTSSVFEQLFQKVKP